MNPGPSRVRDLAWSYGPDSSYKKSCGRVPMERVERGAPRPPWREARRGRGRSDGGAGAVPARTPGQQMAGVETDPSGRALQVVFVLDDDDTIYIIHPRNLRE